MTTRFTDLLDEYLAANKESDEAREKFAGEYDADYFLSRQIDRLAKATDALNEAFDRACKGEQT